MTNKDSRMPKNADIVKLLEVKYLSEPEKFRAFMPDIAQMLDRVSPPRRSNNGSFNLTERERTYHRKILVNMLQVMDDRGLSPQKAVRVFEHCASLIMDGSLLEEVGHDTRVNLIKTALGNPPDSFREETTIAITDENAAALIVNKVPIVRGVYLELDEDVRLISISVSPSKVRERQKLMGIVGIGRDAKSDVSIGHDDYLAEIDPHGAS